MTVRARDGRDTIAVCDGEVCGNDLSYDGSNEIEFIAMFKKHGDARPYARYCTEDCVPKPDGGAGGGSSSPPPPASGNSTTSGSSDMMSPPPNSSAGTGPAPASL